MRVPLLPVERRSKRLLPSDMAQTDVQAHAAAHTIRYRWNIGSDRDRLQRSPYTRKRCKSDKAERTSAGKSVARWQVGTGTGPACVY